MIKYKAKDIKTGEWVYGDLAYVQTKKRIKPMIVTHAAAGGMIYILGRHEVDEKTIERYQ